MQESIRKESVNQNKQFNQHRKQEIEVREFNKNLIINKNKKNDNFHMKDPESYIYGYRAESPENQMEVGLDPILEANEKRKKDLENTFKKFQQRKEEQEAHNLIGNLI